MLKLFTCAVVVLLFFGGAQSQTTSNLTIQHDGLTREYILYIPISYFSQPEVPLLFNLHGYTSNNTQQMAYGDFRPIADTAAFIIAHPNGTIDGNGNRFWSAFGNSTVDDVGFISALIDTISSNYNIDLNRVYSTGMSNGGFMSYELACELGDRITAVASVTGTMTVNKITSCNPIKPTPVMQIHGTNDATVPYNGNATFASVPDVVDFWVNHNNCDGTPVQTNVPDNDPNDNSTAEQYVYQNGDLGTTVELFKVIDGGHTWPGAPIDIGVTNHDFDASIEIWRFFSQYEMQSLLNAEELARENPYNIYPNPSKGKVTVNLNSNISKIKITDELGRQLKSINTQQKDVVDLQLGAAGVYFIRLFDHQNNETIKRVVVE